MKFIAIFVLSLAALIDSAQAEDSRLDEAKAAFDRIDYETSFALFLPLANEGNDDAKLTLGWFFQFGHGVKQNCAEAIRWYQQVIEKSGALAQYRLGTVYEMEKCGKDLDKAISWYRKAADIGDKRAQHRLSAMYYTGEGVKQDYKESFAWEQKSAERGYVEAQVSLGNMYFDGVGVEKDYGKAIYWYQKAGENGDTDILCHLAHLYLYGKGVERDQGMAQYWLDKATKKGASPKECSRDKT